MRLVIIAAPWSPAPLLLHLRSNTSVCKSVVDVECSTLLTEYKPETVIVRVLPIMLANTVKEILQYLLRIERGSVISPKVPTGLLKMWRKLAPERVLKAENGARIQAVKLRESYKAAIRISTNAGMK